MALEKERQKSLEMEMMTKELRQQCAELEFQLAERQREVIQVAQQHELEKMRRMQSSPDQDRAELEHALKMVRWYFLSSANRPGWRIWIPRLNLGMEADLRATAQFIASTDLSPVPSDLAGPD
jgi:hypothetical protein